MRITEIKIENFKCWRGEHIFNFKKYTALIGENSAGKTALQEAIYYSMINEKLQTDLISRGEMTKIRINFSLSLSENDKQAIINVWKNNPAVVNSELNVLLNSKYSFWNQFGKEIWNLYRTNSWSQEYRYHVKHIEGEPPKEIFNFFEDLLRRDYSINIKGNTVLHNILNWMKNSIIAYLKTSIARIPTDRKIEDENTGEIVRISTFFKGDRVKRLLFNAKISMKDYERERYHLFQKIVGSWSFTPSNPDISSEAGKQIDLFFTTKKNEKILIEEMGEGIQKAVIIAAICLLEPDKIFLIEEPELNLHPRALRELREMLRNEIKGQVIISTHNPVFINQIDEKTSVFKIIKKEETSNAIEIKNKEDLRGFKNQFNLLNSDFLFEDILVFVEGVSDYHSFENWFEIIYPHQLSTRFLHVGGYKEIHPALILSLMLQLDQNFSYYIIVDSDTKDSEERKTQIIERLKGRAPNLTRHLDQKELNDLVIVLKAENLEEYIKNATRSISDILEINEEIAKKILNDKSKRMIDRLESLFEKYGKDENRIFKKSKHLKLITEKMEEKEIHPEIKKIISKFRQKEESL